jgi:hypothetical protein
LFRTAFTDFFSGRGKSMAYVGTALALTGVGTATGAAASSSSPAPQAVSASRHVNVGDDAGAHAGSALVIAPKAPAKPAQHAAPKPVAHKAPVHKAAPQHAAKKASVHVVHHASKPVTWQQIRDKIANDTYPKPAPHKLPLRDRLTVNSTSGPQAYMPVTSSRMANATTIVRQALSRHMGLRSAVIAVATAMQESTLENINYGDRDSLGLFQQRPSAGWGSPSQITNPVYAANAFLNALHSHQSADPDWATQPLWSNAQAVQVSGFPYAYAKWEAQAAQLVQGIAKHMS